jgi:hypothetical protein
VRTALVILLGCAVADLVLCTVVLAIVWVAHQRQRKRAAAAGETIPSAAGQFGCLIAFAVAGFVILYGSAWYLLSE